MIFMGGVGLGKSHLASALGYAACQHRHSVLFTAVDVINTLTRGPSRLSAQSRTQAVLLAPAFVSDEVGYLPIDKTGADLLFQVISQRYERGSIVLTTNQPYKTLGQDLQQRQHADQCRSGPRSCITPTPSLSRAKATA